MDFSPGLLLAALFLWFLPLFAIRSELDFLRQTPGLPRSQWILSGAIFCCFVTVDASFWFHQRFANVVVFTAFITALLTAMILLSLLLLSGRLKIFREMSKARREERREMLSEVRDLIDEQKRAKIRAKYGEAE